MKQKIALAVFILTSFQINAQVDHYYQRISLKTNVASLLSLGLEFPLKDNLTVEYNIRKIRTGIFEKNIHRDERLHFKYHWPLRSGFMDQKRSFYLMAGLRSSYRSYEKKIRPEGGYESAYLNRNLFVYGAGFQLRRFDFWLAMERTVYEKDNSFTRTDAQGNLLSQRPWKGSPSFSLGVNIILYNFRK